MDKDFLMGQVDQLRSIVDELETHQNKKTNIYDIMNETIDESFWTMGLNLNFETAQPSIKKIIGYSEEELLNTSFESYISKESVDIFKAKLNEEVLYIKEHPRKNLDYFERMILNFKHKDKTVDIWCEVKIKLLLDDKLEPVSIFGTIKDVTEQRLIEEILYKKLDMNEEKYKKELEDTQEELKNIKLELEATKKELQELKNK